MKNILRWLSAAVALQSSLALADPTWDGTWAGITKKGEAVSVTIADGKVTAYTIKGAEPYAIGYSKITLTTVRFGDREHFSVKLVKTGVGTAFGAAHSPMGDGSALLVRK